MDWLVELSPQLLTWSGAAAASALVLAAHLALSRATVARERAAREELAELEAAHESAPLPPQPRPEGRAEDVDRDDGERCRSSQDSR